MISNGAVPMDNECGTKLSQLRHARDSLQSLMRQRGSYSLGPEPRGRKLVTMEEFALAAMRSMLSMIPPRIENMDVVFHRSILDIPYSISRCHSDDGANEFCLSAEGYDCIRTIGRTIDLRPSSGTSGDQSRIRSRRRLFIDAAKRARSGLVKHLPSADSQSPPDPESVPLLASNDEGGSSYS